MEFYFLWVPQDTLNLKKFPSKGVVLKQKNFFFALKIAKFNFSDSWKCQQRRFNDTLFFSSSIRSPKPEKYPLECAFKKKLIFFFFALMENYFWILLYLKIHFRAIHYFTFLKKFPSKHTVYWKKFKSFQLNFIMNISINTLF